MDKELANTWTRLLPDADYLYADDGEGEHPPAGWTTTFPHPVTTPLPDGRRASHWASTPFADHYLARLAMAAVDELKMGQTAGTDYLAMSFSVLDSAGHAFGPRSHEVQDVLHRLDRTIGELLAHLDKQVGAGRYVVALTGDHGVARRFPSSPCVSGSTADAWTSKALTSKIEELLSAKSGAGKYISRVAYTDLYFAPGVFDRLKQDDAHATRGARRPSNACRESRACCFATSSRIRRPPTIRSIRAARLSYMRSRSGDLILVPKPYWLMSTAATTHGTHHGYDKHVPVLFYGAGIRPGRYWDDASPSRHRADTRRALRYHARAHRRPRAVVRTRIDGASRTSVRWTMTATSDELPATTPRVHLC